ncbi:MAG: polyphosphate kinase 1 [Treponema sp.]|nr:polyphosphate kinase 1 [Treponema sp.]
MKYFNRDISWVEFNARILNEGMRKDNPLLERLKFLSIVGTNFDEFFQVRVASLKRQISISDEIDISGDKFSEIMQKISERSHEIIGTQYRELQFVLDELSENGIRYVKANSMSDSQKTFAQNYFQREIFPLLTPLRTDSAFPHIPGKEIFAAFELSVIEGIHTNIASSKNCIALVQVPKILDRIVWLPTEDASSGRTFTLLDDIIIEFGTQLFPGFSVDGTILFSIDRDADLMVDEESGDFVGAMEEVIASRQNSFAVRLLISGDSSKLQNFLQTNLELSDIDVYEIEQKPGILRPDCLISLCDNSTFAFSTESMNSAKKLFFPTWKNFNPFKKSEKSIWDYIKERDRILNLPYESFDPVLKLLSGASDDGKTLAIKMTLYRTEKNSEIVKSLIRAARNGKQVTVFVELKARFDEQRNISWASQLEKAGAIVIYGIVNLKVHGKAMMIIRKENDGIRRYVHLSTGNYNAKTAKTYSDMALMTTNAEIANDVTLFFNLISGYSAIQTMSKIAIAPVNLKSKLISLIKREAENSTKENPGMIVAKMNSLGHEEIIDALYEASRKGVKIYLNVRGICQLVPNVENQSENIKVVSIVGRYLEHARIMYFKNSGNEELYLSSADWMPRNLDRRVELLFPISDKKCFEEIKENLMTYFEDNTHSSILNSDGTWIRYREQTGTWISAQEKMYERSQKKNETAKKEGATFIVRRK